MKFACKKNNNNIMTCYCFFFQNNNAAGTILMFIGIVEFCDHFCTRFICHSKIIIYIYIHTCVMFWAMFNVCFVNLNISKNGFVLRFYYPKKTTLKIAFDLIFTVSSFEKIKSHRNEKRNCDLYSIMTQFERTG